MIQWRNKKLILVEKFDNYSRQFRQSQDIPHSVADEQSATNEIKAYLQPCGSWDDMMTMSVVNDLCMDTWYVQNVRKQVQALSDLVPTPSHIK